MAHSTGGMESNGLTLIGFGEAAQAFVADLACPACTFDRKTLDPGTRDAKQEEADRAGVRLAASNAQAVRGATVILSLVTADQALSAARETAANMEKGALFLDMNSVAPDTKRAAVVAVTAAGGRYVDVAVMAPVHPGRRTVPLLLSGSDAQEAMAALQNAGFSNARVVGLDVGAASAIKMIRSVLVKGVEALTAECMLAAAAAGVKGEVLASLNASPAPTDWTVRADYNLDRMMVHGLRRAEEMDEVVKTLEALGTGATMSRGTVARQRAVGKLRLSHPPAGLEAKLASIFHALAVQQEQAA